MRLAGALSIGLAVVARAPLALGARPPSIDVVVIGSSTAAGKNLDLPEYGGSPTYQCWAMRYLDYLRGLNPASTLTNLAVPSSTTFEAMPTGTQNPSGYPPPDPAHNITAALARSPDDIIVAYQLGNGASTTQIMSNLNRIRTTALAAGVRIWFSTPMPRPSTASPAELAQIPELGAAITSTFGARSLDFFHPLADQDGFAKASLFLTDDQHPNQVGHDRLYQVVVTAGIAPIPVATVPIPGYAIAVLGSMLLVAGGALARR
jgi:hypothetical protein